MPVEPMLPAPPSQPTITAGFGMAPLLRIPWIWLVSPLPRKNSTPGLLGLSISESMWLSGPSNPSRG